MDVRHRDSYEAGTGTFACAGIDAEVYTSTTSGAKDCTNACKIQQPSAEPQVGLWLIMLDAMKVSLF